MPGAPRRRAGTATWAASCRWSRAAPARSRLPTIPVADSAAAGLASRRSGDTAPVRHRDDRRRPCGGRPFARNPALPAEAGAAHHARLAAAEGRADRDAGAVADRALVAHGQRRLAVLGSEEHTSEL